MFNTLRWLAVPLTLALAGCALWPGAQAPVETAKPAPLPAAQETQAYLCEGGETIQVAYQSRGEGFGLVAIVYQDQLSLMRPWPAASGARYISLDEQLGLRWHIQGDEGLLAHLPPDHTASEQMLLRGCRPLSPGATP